MAFSPVFIVGNSRSGTTLLARILNNHSQVHILKETHLWTLYEEQRKSFSHLEQQDRTHLLNLLLTIEYRGINYKNEYLNYSDEAKELFPRFARCKTFSSLIACFFKFVAAKNGKIISGDQTPAHLFYIKDILHMFPNAKFVNIVRDPRAVLLSQKNKWKAAKQIGQPFSEVVRTFFNYHPITTSLLWKKGVEAGRLAKSDLPSNVFHTIKFEQLLEEPQSVLQELSSFLRIDFENSMLNVDVAMSSNETDEGKKGIRREVMNHWRKRLSATEIFISESINGKLAEEEGYRLTHTKTEVISLIYYFCYFPLHLALAFISNINRVRNPFSYISKIFIRHKQKFDKPIYIPSKNIK